MKIPLKVLMAVLLLSLTVGLAVAEPLFVADFSASGLDGWEEKKFSGKTEYRLVPSGEQQVVMAQSQGSASGLVKRITVDLKKYPYLNWRWRIDQRLGIEDETVKSGDDYAARIYVIIDGGILPWRTRAVNYVWADRALQGETWPNAFGGKRAMMIALRNRQDSTATWYAEKRNVYEDVKRLFGPDFDTIDAVALMTDTDNIQGQARSFYGDIFFSAE